MELEGTLRAESLSVLIELERLDACDQFDGTPREQRVRCITPAMGRLLHTLVLIRQPTRILELGTSVGYSTIWLASAAQSFGASILSVDNNPSKQERARRNLSKAGLAEVVELRLADALKVAQNEPGLWDFVFIDIDASLYLPCFEALLDKISHCGMILADGWRNTETWFTEPVLIAYREHLRQCQNLLNVLLPFEKGLMVAIRSD